MPAISPIESLSRKPHSRTTTTAIRVHSSPSLGEVFSEAFFKAHEPDAEGLFGGLGVYESLAGDELPDFLIF